MTFQEMRESSGLTQEMLAERASVDQTTVSQIETGKVRSPRYATVSRLAQALGRTTDEVAAAISSPTPALETGEAGR